MWEVQKDMKLYVSATPAIQSAVSWSWGEQGSRSRHHQYLLQRAVKIMLRGLGFIFDSVKSPKTVRAGKALNFHLLYKRRSKQFNLPLGGPRAWIWPFPLLQENVSQQ